VQEQETALDLAVAASQKLFEYYDKTLIDFVLFCTQSPDYYLPSTACILQDRLDLGKSTGALDFNLGCSGYIYGLALAKGLINTGVANNVLLVTAETYSKFLHPQDKANRTIFGDGAAVTVLEKYSEDKIFEFVLGSDGSGAENLIVRNGAAKSKFDNQPVETADESGNISSDNHLYMAGPEIFNFTIDRIPEVIYEALTKNNTTLADLDYVVFHQANKYMLTYLRRKLGIPEDKFYINLTTTGNTVSATIPIALKECLSANKVQAGDKVLLVGFGVGYSWGATVIEI
jgi:3-oxoacyl-[acyl-carrier-protein] synthase-3